MKASLLLTRSSDLSCQAAFGSQATGSSGEWGRQPRAHFSPGQEACGQVDVGKGASLLCPQRTKAWDSRTFRIPSRTQVNWRGWIRKQKGVVQGAWYFHSERKVLTSHTLWPHSFPYFHSPNFFSPN